MRAHEIAEAQQQYPQALDYYSRVTQGAQALDLGALGLADRVGDVFERQALVVGIDREDLLEHGLEAVGLALLLGDVLLEELEIRADLELDEVGRLDDFAEFAEVDAFGVSAVGHGIPR